MYNHAASEEDKVRSYLEPDSTEREILQYLNDNYDRYSADRKLQTQRWSWTGWPITPTSSRCFTRRPSAPAMADVLTGKVSPSGRTVDTFAADASASPAAQNFGDYAYYDENGSITKYNYVTYEEGIYVGYRYYETRYEDVVLDQGDAGDYDYARRGRVLLSVTA